MKLIFFLLVTGFTASFVIAAPDSLRVPAGRDSMSPSPMDPAVRDPMPPSPMDPAATSEQAKANAKQPRKTKKPDVAPSPMDPAARDPMPSSPMGPSATN